MNWNDLWSLTLVVPCSIPGADCTSLPSSQNIVLKWNYITGNLSNTEQPGSYGQLNVPNSGNRPGARDSAAMTLHPDGQSFYVFGGYGLGWSMVIGMYYFDMRIQQFYASYFQVTLMIFGDTILSIGVGSGNGVAPRSMMSEIILFTKRFSVNMDHRKPYTGP